MTITSSSAVISLSGISSPSYEEVLAWLKVQFQTIYGADAYLEADSQDGQLLAIFAKAITDTNLAAVAAYNSFSPQTAVGVGLSNVVKINHLQRLIASPSEVNLTVTGVAGTIVTNGIAGDAAGNRWLLPASVTITGGSVIVTATAEFPGAIAAAIGTVTEILTPTPGWQGVTNATAASLGSPVETDAQLRRRQAMAPAMNAKSVIASMISSLQALPGVTFASVYENDTAAVDANGVPANALSAVVAGGVAADIAETIYKRKTPGAATYGSTTVSITDASGAARDIHFYVLTLKAIKVGISLHPEANYNANVGAAIKQAVADYINAFAVDEDLVVNRLYAPALLNGAADSLTYKITVLQAALVAGVLGTSDVPIAFNERASCSPSDVTITLV